MFKFKKFLIKLLGLQELEVLKCTNYELTKKIEKLTTENTNLHDNNRLLVEKFNNTSSYLEKLQTENFNMVAEIDSLKMKEKQYINQFSTIFAAYNKVSMDNSRKNENAEGLCKKIKSLKTFIEEQENTIKTLKSQVLTLKARIKKIKKDGENTGKNI